MAVEVVSSSLAISFPTLVAERVSSTPMTATQTTTNASPAQRATSELAAALASVRIFHSYPARLYKYFSRFIKPEKGGYRQVCEHKSIVIFLMETLRT